MTKKREKRAENRKPFSKSVEFELNRIGSDKGGFIQVKGTGVDLSSKGLGFLTGISLRPGEILKLRLPSYPNGFTLPVLSEVRWANSEEERYRVGVQFIS